MTATVKVDFSQKTGKRVQALHGFNAGPMTKVFTYDARPFFVQGGFPYVRLHDCEYPFGSGEFIDIPCIFKNFDADENDPASYNFGNTDEYIRQCLNVGSKIIYRLGVSIEHSPVKRYTAPPKDFAKWARICEHIIRHYNEGWADGHRWNIEYWEIWNEADLDRATDNKRCWAGTAAEFGEFYTVAARHLKACFPHLKIGGCGFSSVRNEFIEDFFKNISARTPRVPMDFYTWHRYKGVAASYAEGAAIVRDLLTEFGYGEVESILDEWNMIYGWDRDNQAESYRAMKDHRGAAFYAAVLCVLQEQTDVCIATQFEADVVKEFCGIFNVKNMCVGGLVCGTEKLAELEPTKGFYAFKSFNLLYRMGESVALSCDHDGVFVTAAAGACANGLLLSNQTGEQTEVMLELRGVQGAAAIRVTDATHTNERIMELSGQSLSLTLPMAPDSFAYVGTDLPDPAPTYEI